MEGSPDTTGGEWLTTGCEKHQRMPRVQAPPGKAQDKRTRLKTAIGVTAGPASADRERELL